MGYDIVEFEESYVIRRKFYGYRSWTFDFLSNSGNYAWVDCVLNTPDCCKFATKEVAEARLNNFKILRGVEV